MLLSVKTIIVFNWLYLFLKIFKNQILSASITIDENDLKKVVSLLKSQNKNSKFQFCFYLLIQLLF